MVALAVVVWATPLGLGSVRTAPVRDFLNYVAGTSLVGLLGAGQRQVVFVLMAVVLSPVGAGLFSLSLLVAGVVRWPLKGINRALSAIAAELYDDDETATIERLYRRTSRVAAFLTVPVVVMTVSHAREILTLFSAAYGTGAPVLVLAVAGQFVAVLAGSNGLLLLMTDNERPTAGLQGLHVVVILPVMVVLARRYGVVGLGAAYALSLLFNNATELWLLRYLEGFRLFTREHWLVAGMCALAALCGSAIAAATPLLLSLPGTVALTAGVTTLIHRKLLTDTDRRMVTVMLRRENREGRRG
jgi:O-antigen/teichoic acid export membrane protein